MRARSPAYFSHTQVWGKLTFILFFLRPFPLLRPVQPPLSNIKFKVPARASQLRSAVRKAPMGFLRRCVKSAVLSPVMDAL